MLSVVLESSVAKHCINILQMDALILYCMLKLFVNVAIIACMRWCFGWNYRMNTLQLHVSTISEAPYMHRPLRTA